MATAYQSRSRCNFEEWMSLQAQDLAELSQVLEQHSQNDQLLTQVAQNSITLFKEYIHRRTQLASNDVSGFLAPIWCATIELPLLWIGGCRPSSFMRLIYAQSGLEMEASLQEFLDGTIANSDDLGGISSRQLLLVDSLRGKTIREEEKLSTQLANLQEDTADQPLAMIAHGLREIGMMTEEVKTALDRHEESLLALLKEADQLRLTTLKELIAILTPLQTVKFLVGSKKLHLALHEWGKQRAQSQI